MVLSLRTSLRVLSWTIIGKVGRGGDGGSGVGVEGDSKAVAMGRRRERMRSGRSSHVDSGCSFLMSRPCLW
jgi:hypothetical protein